MATDLETSLSAAETVYFLARLELAAGEELDLEALCRAHPALAAKLRRVHWIWAVIRGLVESRGVAAQVRRVLARLGIEGKADYRGGR